MTDILDMTWDRVWEAIEKIETMSSEEKEEIGDKAFEFIADYPLYAATDGISYDEAILIALVIGKEDFIESLNPEE